MSRGALAMLPVVVILAACGSTALSPASHSVSYPLGGSGRGENGQYTFKLLFV